MHVTAAEILEWAHRRKIQQIHLPNTTSRPRPAIADKVERMGIRIDPGRILTPPAAARRRLLEYGVDGVALFVPEAIGLNTLLVRTGKFRPQDLEGHVKPDAVIDSSAELPEWRQDNVPR
jgi:ribonucleotide monophosphatase NagD (HAD superfamily)